MIRICIDSCNYLAFSMTKKVLYGSSPVPNHLTRDKHQILLASVSFASLIYVLTWWNPSFCNGSDSSMMLIFSWVSLSCKRLIVGSSCLATSCKVMYSFSVMGPCKGKFCGGVFCVRRVTYPCYMERGERSFKF